MPPRKKPAQKNTNKSDSKHDPGVEPVADSDCSIPSEDLADNVLAIAYDAAGAQEPVAHDQCLDDAAKADDNPEKVEAEAARRRAMTANDQYPIYQDDEVGDEPVATCNSCDDGE